MQSQTTMGKNFPLRRICQSFSRNEIRERTEIKRTVLNIMIQEVHKKNRKGGKNLRLFLQYVLTMETLV